MKRTSDPFKWRHYEPPIILLCVRWYCRYALSYRDLAEMMCERGLGVDHSTIFRWVQRYAPEINKRIRPHLKLTTMSYRVDETYLKVGKDNKYLSRAVDSKGNTISVHALSEAQRCCGKTVLQEDDARLSSSNAAHDQHGQECRLPGCVCRVTAGAGAATRLQTTPCEKPQ